MPFASALSTAVDTKQALQDVVRQVRDQFGAAYPQLACVFYSPSHSDEAEAIVATLQAELKPSNLLGCLGESIIGNGREVEHGAALALWIAGWETPVEIESFHLHADRTGDGTGIMGWPDVLFEGNPTDAVMLVFGDPFTFPGAELFLPQMNEDYPGIAVMGGMSSNPGGPGVPCLIRNDEIHRDGAVGVMLRGVRWRSVVSQGCKPIGRPLVVTKAQDNIVVELGGRKPLEYLVELREELPAHERELFNKGLLVGVALSEYRETFGRGDFLIRNLYAIDRNTGVMAITDRVRVGQTIQFHVRDAESADEDLRRMMEGMCSPQKPSAALIFSCNGRGTRLFEGPDHDAAIVQTFAGAIPVAGFFAAGEIGPVMGKNFMHGFTASVMLFD